MLANAIIAEVRPTSWQQWVKVGLNRIVEARRCKCWLRVKQLTLAKKYLRCREERLLQRIVQAKSEAFAGLERLLRPIFGSGAVIGLVQMGHRRAPTLAANRLFHAMPRHRLVWRVLRGARLKRPRPRFFGVR